MNGRTDVLIVGAGPSGLVLALWLARAGVSCRIIDKDEAAANTSRAMVVHARTLELYRALGLAETCIAAGAPIRTVRMRVRGREVARLPFGAIGEGLSPYPFALSLPQDRHECILEWALAEAGVAVERNTTFAGSVQSAEGVTARLVSAGGGAEEVRARYVVGCDGFQSGVREALGIAMAGGTYSQRFFVADTLVVGDAHANEIVAALGEDDFHLLFALPDPGAARIIGIVRGESETSDAELAEGIIESAQALLGVTVRETNWLSTYRVHHRVAERFRMGRVFLAGDAAHVHSPAGAQGLNTGVGDAINLAWKLAAVIRGSAGDALLDSYEEERRPFALRLVRTTDQAFAAAVSSGSLAKALRLRVLPRLAPRLLRFPRVRGAVFRFVSQIAISYRGGALASGGLGSVRGGDRLPWCPDPDNYAVADSGRWHLQLYRAASLTDGELAECRRHAEELGLPVHVFDLTAGARRAGLVEGSYLVRPDAYVASASRDWREVLDHFRRLGLGYAARTGSAPVPPGSVA